MKRLQSTSFSILALLLIFLCFLQTSRTARISEEQGGKRVKILEQNSSSLPVPKDKSQAEMTYGLGIAVVEQTE